MDKELSKKKNDMLKSIMANPKLSKSFVDALKSPIGSTKREQAKAIFSIMKKVEKNHYDGMGGPVSGFTSDNTALVAPKNYGNTVIFPSAGAFKTPTTTEPTSPLGSGIKLDPINIDKTTGGLTSDPYQWNKVSSGLSKDYSKLSPNIGDVSTMMGGTPPRKDSPFSGIKLPEAPITTERRPVSGLAGVYEDVQVPNMWTDIQNTIKTNQLKADNRAAGLPEDTGIPDTGVVDTGIPDTGAVDTTGAPTLKTMTGTPPGAGAPVGPISDADKIKATAAAAVKAGTGAGLFAKGVTDEKFGGSLDEYLNNLDTKLKADFDLSGLENELSTLKSQKANLVPTLTNYIQGKDQYLKLIDGMIDQTEGTLLKQDMGNPAVAASYNKYLNYLYALKGRQSQRYGNYLTAAVADYTADVDATQANYDNIYDRYNDVISRKTDIANTEYTALYDAMSSMYTSLENAPIRQASLEALQLQNQKNSLEIIADIIDQSSNTNPEYLKDVDRYSKHITDDDGNLSMESIGAGGLAGFFSEINYEGGDTQAAIKAINTAMATSITNSGGDLGKVKQFKDMIGDLAQVEGGAQLAGMISPALNNSSSELMSVYVLNNLSSIKDATKGLVTGGWFGGATGLENKEKWLKANDSIDSGVLEDLYDVTSNSLSSGTYAENPKQFVDDWFTGNSDEEIAKNISSDLIRTW